MGLPAGQDHRKPPSPVRRRRTGDAPPDLLKPPHGRHTNERERTCGALHATAVPPYAQRAADGTARKARRHQDRDRWHPDGAKTSSWSGGCGPADTSTYRAHQPFNPVLSPWLVRTSPQVRRLPRTYRAVFERRDHRSAQSMAQDFLRWRHRSARQRVPYIFNKALASHHFR
jgi:hypothetical protein